MRAPKVFFCMIAVLLVFAASTYYLSDSISETIIKSIIAAIVLQVGYFIGIVYFVAKEARARRAALGHQEPAHAREMPSETKKIVNLAKTNRSAMRNH
ncbi:exopolysaccharide production repressor protein [Rhizobium sp.]|jgi:exopolysaccharide production repressor protein|uniref:exopolysaccharide production repressor protein n=1 Tax=Rhizobium sp. TaxID=391 RepID=UPI000E9F8E99|nr:exopolysaccharide production repressor exox [Rhizobium sp.]